MRRTACVLLGVVLIGCLGPRVDRTRYFTLTPVATSDDADGAATGDTTDLALGLGPITFPGYLDRQYLVRRVDANQIVVSGTDSWAEPLRDVFARTLQQNLITLLGSARVMLYPWSPSARPGLVLGVEVQSFETAPDGAATLSARWIVRRAADGTVLDVHQSRITEPAPGGQTDAEVAALSRGLAAMAREMAAAVRAEHAAGHERAPAGRRG